MEILRFLVVVIGATLLFPEYARPFDITQSEYEDTNNHLLALQDVIIEPTSYRVDAYSDFNITFRLAPSYQTITLKLQPSLDIIAPDAYIRHLDKDGRSVHGGPIERSAHKVFKGIVFVGQGRQAERWLGTDIHDKTWRKTTVRRNFHSLS